MQPGTKNQRKKPNFLHGILSQIIHYFLAKFNNGNCKHYKSVMQTDKLNFHYILCLTGFCTLDDGV